MMNTDPINERYEKQKEKIDRFHFLLEDIYNDIKEFMQPYNATMYAMMYIQNQTIEKLICALQAMENA